MSDEDSTKGTTSQDWKDWKDVDDETESGIITTGAHSANPELFPQRGPKETMMDTTTCKPRIHSVNTEKKKKVLLTGGGGFVGSHVAQALLERGDYVVIVDEMNDYYDTSIKWGNIKRLQESYGEERLKFFPYDIADHDLMFNLFRTERFEWVVHVVSEFNLFWFLHLCLLTIIIMVSGCSRRSSLQP